jgi:hypothetical protein
MMDMRVGEGRGGLGGGGGGTCFIRPIVPQEDARLGGQGLK